MEIKDLKDLELIKDIFQETDLVVEDTAVNKDIANHDGEDIDIICRDCGRHFVFSIGEQQFYKSKNFPFPKRCKKCSKKRRRKFLNYK